MNKMSDTILSLATKLMMLENGVDDILKQEIQNIKFDGIINTIQYSTEDEKIKDDLLNLVLKLIKTYYDITGEDLITDEKYDQLQELYKERFGHTLVGLEKGGDHVHKYPRLRGTTEKIHFITNKERTNDSDNRRTFEEFLTTTFNKLGYVPKQLKALMSLKVDGISAVAECDEKGVASLVLKRGDTDNNKAHEIVSLRNINISNNIGDHYKEIALGLKTEIAMTMADFEEFTKHWSAKTPRSAVTSICNSEEIEAEKIKYLTIVPLQIQVEGEEYEVPSYPDEYCTEVDALDAQSVREGIAAMYKIHVEKGLPADGVVIRFLDQEIIEKLGRDNDVNNYEVAYKFPAGEAETVLETVEFSLGILGGITPVGKLKPVNIKGVKISNVSIGSIGRFKKLNLTYGEKVLIRHDVIPYLEKIDKEVNGIVIPIPTECPVCKTALTEDGDELSCKNPLCEGLVRGKILNYVTKMDIGVISIQTIDDLFREGYLTRISDLYILHRHKDSLEQISGYGQRSVSEIIRAIDEKKEVLDYIFLGSLGIKGIGRKIFKKIMSELSFKEFIDLVKDDKKAQERLIKINGVGSKTIKDIIQFFAINYEEIEQLLKFVTIKRSEGIYVPNSMKILFSKVRDKEMENKLELDGHEVVSGYNNTVDIVVVPYVEKNGKQISSSKIDSARKDGKLIISLEDFKKEYSRLQELI